MPNLKIVNHLKQATEQERVNFFFGAIVARTWNVMTLEEVLSCRHHHQVRTLEMLLAQVSEVSALSNSFTSMLGFSSINPLSPNVQAKVRAYNALPINERINKVKEFKEAVLQLDTSLYNTNPITRIHNKDFNLFINIQSLIDTYAAAIYENSETAAAISLLTDCLDKLCRDEAITNHETQLLLRIYNILSSAIIDPKQQQEFILLFKIALDQEINLFAGLNKTRKFLLNTCAEVNQPQWNSIKSKMTFLGSGKTPDGFVTIRGELNDIHTKTLENKDVFKLFSAVYSKLKDKVDKKPMKRTDATHAFYVRKLQEADALKTSEVQVYSAAEARRNRRP